ncbi:zinc ribbon domain-containing protein [Streptococcus pneumoniae]
MDFLTQFKEKAVQVGGFMKETTQTVISEQQKNSEINRKKKEIAQLQEKIDDLYRLIGIQYIQNFYDESSEETVFRDELERIKDFYHKQLQLQREIDLDFSDSRECQCGEQVSLLHLFCPYCGKTLKKDM